MAGPNALDKYKTNTEIDVFPTTLSFTSTSFENLLSAAAS
jgi:hypothetical protein